MPPERPNEDEPNEPSDTSVDESAAAAEPEPAALPQTAAQPEAATQAGIAAQLEPGVDIETGDEPSLEEEREDVEEPGFPEEPEAAEEPVDEEAAAAAAAASLATTAPPDPETRIREIGTRLYKAMAESGPADSAASFVTGRSMQRRILARAMADPIFKARLFQFVDVYPSIRDSGDLLRHLRSYLGDVDVPRPLDRLVATDKRRLPSWAAKRLTERGMQRMAETLIAGRDATDALPTLKRLRRRHTGFTIDLLGEACLSDVESADYARRYHDLLDYLPNQVARWSEDPRIDQSPYGPEPRVNLSLKLTCFYSQIDPADFEGSRQALVRVLKPLFVKARDKNVFLNIDIERFVHRDLTYAAFADLARDPELRDYPHLGVVVQAYMRDSAEIAQGLVYLARDRGTPITVRLVKGAYWDYETILAAQEHWPSPVFLRKAETDAQFERLAKKFVDNWQWTRPALGTHNIRSIAFGIAAAEAAGLPPRAVEIQVLHGMADAIRRAAVKQGYRVREYVPVGELIPGMAYLVRRLLENTANESFLRLTFAEHEDPGSLLAPPSTKLAEEDEAARRLVAERRPAGTAADRAAALQLAGAAARSGAATGQAPTSAGPFAEAAERRACAPFQNEPHTDFTREENRKTMAKALGTIDASGGRDYPLLVDGSPVQTGQWIDSVNPARPSQVVGRVAAAGKSEADRALASARAAFPMWRDTPPAERADVLFQAAAAMRAQRFELAALEVIEAGKPWREADADVAEAIDFLEYYGREALRLSGVWQLTDVPGESDLYFYEPRGVAAVIAPWNFPLAIPTGMVSAALVAGNSVVFKPATPTPVLGYALVRILHEAGVPGGVLGFLPGPGGEIGDFLSADPRVDLIAFTGSLDVGTRIMEQAAGAQPGQRNIKRVITEMGGKNAIIIDTDADMDAAVEGVVASAFNYAGQKCSACSRVVVLDTIYDQFLRRLTQATASLRSGDPADPGTRVGPVITADARDRIFGFIEIGKGEASLVVPVPGDAGDGGGGAEGEWAGVDEADAPELVAAATEAADAGAAQTGPSPTQGPSVAAAAPGALNATRVDTAADAPGEKLVGGTAAEAAGAELAAGEAAAEAAGTTRAGEPEPQVPIAIRGFDPADKSPAPLTDEQDPPQDEQAFPDGEQAASAGERAAAGLEKPGYYVAPHIFAGVPPSAVIAQDEIFGPVLSVIRAANFDEALEIALGVRYGLTGGLYSRNPAHIMRAAREFRVGNLYINRPITGAMVGRQPFGGSRMSGVGSKAGGPDYLLQFMEPRVVTENLIRRGFAPDMMPTGS
jgi:RHH-type proline utilization regulon transcriptional repressor/proline dehydrogenase/delta 1-pyrroline-5-carboxylate dehydrogenase